MTLQQFIDKNNGKYIDLDGKYGCQCVDLMRAYVRDVLGKDPYCIPRADYAKNIFKNFSSNKDFTKIINNPNDAKQFPKAGDIVFWGTYPFVTGIAGHVAICTGGNGYKFICFTQNYPTNSPCRYYNYDYRGVLGWLTPKK